MSATSTPSSFRKQLTTTVTVGILALAIIIALTTAWITTRNIHDQMVDDGLQVSKTVAEQSVLSLLYGSGDNAADAFNAALGFPSIIHVALLTNDGTVLLGKGIQQSDLPQKFPGGEQPLLTSENADEWIFMAPVYSEGQIEATDSAIALAQQENAKRELLGAVVVVKSKGTLKQTVTAIFTNTLLVTMVVTSLLLFIIHRNFSRLTRPLSELAQMMGRAEEGEARAYTTLHAPQEVHDIGRAFNKMMEALAERDAQLRHHNELLEYEVSQRTQELVYARDMAIEANRNKSDFLSRVSHELRTPLQSIIGFSDLILEELPAEMGPVRRDIETIIANATNLLTMINSVLDMSKLESGRMDLDLTEVDLEKLIGSVTNTVTPLLRASGNRLETKLHLVRKHVVIDEAKLRQILLNLLANAIKFTDAGLIELEVTLNTQVLQMMVIDTGIGMDEEQLEHIFDPFYQADGTITRRYQGTGLGLTITHQFCRLMGGTIHVRSRRHKGSSFEIQIPIPIKETRDHADS